MQLEDSGKGKFLYFLQDLGKVRTTQNHPEKWRCWPPQVEFLWKLVDFGPFISTKLGWKSMMVYGIPTDQRDKNQSETCQKQISATRPNLCCPTQTEAVKLRFFRGFAGNLWEVTSGFVFSRVFQHGVFFQSSKFIRNGWIFYKTFPPANHFSF